MAEAVLEKAVCMSCGADVRDGTYYCYACGKPVIIESEEESDAATETSTVESEEAILKSDKSGKLATAAAERKKSRVGQRKPRQVIWEEPGAATNRVFVLTTLLIFILAAGVVFLTVFMK